MSTDQQAITNEQVQELVNELKETRQELKEATNLEAKKLHDVREKNDQKSDDVLDTNTMDKMQEELKDVYVSKKELEAKFTELQQHIHNSEHNNKSSQSVEIKNGYEELKNVLLEKKNLLQATGTDAQGGYAIHPEIVKRVQALVTTIHSMRNLVNIVSISTDSYETIMQLTRPEFAWVSETGTRDNDQSITLGKAIINVHEAYLSTPLTTRMIEDAQGFNPESFLRDQVMMAKQMAENKVTLKGTGDANNQPTGILTSTGTSAVSSIVTGHATNISFDNIKELFFAVPKEYRYNENFHYVMHTNTLLALMKLKDGNNQYIYKQAVHEKEYDTLYGRRVALNDEMPEMGVVNNAIICAGDFRTAYTMVERIGMTVLRDPYTMYNTGKVVLGFRFRLGGGVTTPEALRLLKQAA